MVLQGCSNGRGDGYQNIIVNDKVAPNIIALKPKVESTINDPYTVLSYSITDDESLLAYQTILVEINGENALEISKFEQGVLSIIPNETFPLPKDKISVTISIEDEAGNKALERFQYYGVYDQIAPSIALISPKDGEILTDPMTPLVVGIEDNEDGTGVNNDSAEVTFIDDNKTYKLEYDANSSVYIYSPSKYQALALGTTWFRISVEDNAKNKAVEEFHVFLKEENVLSAQPIASPKVSYAPATIRFSPQVSTDNAIQRYYWDFNGDGSYERNDITANSYTWQYTVPGDYNVTLKVVDVKGKEFLGSTIVHILNTPPQVSVESSPSNGEIPLTVNFTVTANDSDGIALYEWDFDGDGVYDYNSTSSGNTSFIYESEGIFNAKLRVTDTRGAVSTYTTPTTKVIAALEGSPSVTASGSPLTGNAPLSVNFLATATDPQDKGFKLYEWDFDGNGVYDFNSSQSASTSHTYEAAGKFYPRVKVTTTDGRVTYDALEITVLQSVSLSVVTDTIDVAQSETTTIHTTTTAKSEMKVVMEDRDHNVIKVLQDWTLREAGSYDDSWDGTDVNGAVVKEGDYYAVLLYKVGNEVKRFDLRDSSGGTRYNPPRSENPRSFAPYDNRPMQIDFSLSRPSEVVSFIGYDYTDTRIVTLRSREVLGTGTYTDTWNALNEEGQMISPPPGRWFLYGIWAFRLADNVIYVKSGAHVSAIIATPPIYTPDAHGEDGKPLMLKIHFNLNKKATIELEVFDATEGITVATRTFKNVPEGDQIVEFDGKDNNGVYLHPGKYSVGIRAVDENGYRSMMEYTITRIYY